MKRASKSRRASSAVRGGSSLQRMVRPLWSDEPPQTEGLYWHHSSEFNVTQMVLIEKNRHGTVVYRMARAHGVLLADYSGLWLGPVLPASCPRSPEAGLSAKARPGERRPSTHSRAAGSAPQSARVCLHCSPCGKHPEYLGNQVLNPSYVGAVKRPNETSSAARPEGGAE